MKVRYHEETDSAYISFIEGSVAANTREIGNDVNVDFTADGKLIGIEILSNAKATLALQKFSISGLKSFEVEPVVAKL